MVVCCVTFLGHCDLGLDLTKLKKVSEYGHGIYQIERNKIYNIQALISPFNATLNPEWSQKVKSVAENDRYNNMQAILFCLHTHSTSGSGSKGQNNFF